MVGPAKARPNYLFSINMSERHWWYQTNLHCGQFMLLSKTLFSLLHNKLCVTFHKKYYCQMYLIYSMYVQIGLSNIVYRIRPSYTVSQVEPTATRSLRKKPPLASHDPHKIPRVPRRVPQDTDITPVISRYPDSMTLPSLVRMWYVICVCICGGYLSWIVSRKTFVMYNTCTHRLTP